MVRRLAQGALVLGLVGLVLSFTTLVRRGEGAAQLLLAGVALLVVGAVLLILPFLRRRTPRRAAGKYANEKSPGASRELLHGWRGYVAVSVSIALCIGMTVYVLVADLDRSILFLLWIVVGGFALMFLARRLTQGSSPPDNSGGGRR